MSGAGDGGGATEQRRRRARRRRARAERGGVRRAAQQRLRVADLGAQVGDLVGRLVVGDQLLQLGLQRREHQKRMRAALVRLERTEHGLVLRFPNDAAVEDGVRQFDVDEKDVTSTKSTTSTT